jgi:hypothetical protein
MHYFLSTIVIALLSSPVSTTSCSAFDASNDPYTQPALRTSIISQGLTCNSKSGDCRVPIGGYVTDRRTLNVTMPYSSASVRPSASHSTILSRPGLVPRSSTRSRHGHCKITPRATLASPLITDAHLDTFLAATTLHSRIHMLKPVRHIR